MLLPLLLAVLTTVPDPIAINDMRAAAGNLRNGVFTLALEAREGVWHPDGPDLSGHTVAAFGVAGQQLQNPGPLVRVTAGTEMRITVHNKLAKALTIFGLGAKRGVQDSTIIAPGASHEFVFKASEPGLFYYAGRTERTRVLDRDMYDSQLNGVIAVDEPGNVRKDRIFLISWWGTLDSTQVSGLMDRATITINGQSWPHTERLHAVQNEPEHYRWVNVTSSVHPLHLHGFYFSVDGVGDGASFKSFAPEQRQLAVTQAISEGGTFDMTWVPQRPGNWILHCHFAGHIATMAALNKDRRMPDPHAQHAGDAEHKNMMEAMVMGIHVAPRGEMKASGLPARTMRLVARSKARVYGEYVGYSYTLDERDAFNQPGPLLILEKDQPVAINIVNRTHESAAVHWHGIELDSYPDGVPNFSGMGSNVLPPIPAGDSLTVQFTPPRAGTFMYHSHMNEFQQISSGMYGAIVVLPPGQKYDADKDRVLLLSDNGPLVDLIRGPYPAVLLNGSLEPRMADLRVGTTYRFRIVNIRSDSRAKIELLDGGQPVQWKLVARDGADLPAAQATVEPAAMVNAPGQIWDVEFTPTKAGELTLRFGYVKPTKELPPSSEVKWIVTR